MKSITKAPAAARDPAGCTQEACAAAEQGAQPDACTPQTLLPARDPAVASQPTECASGAERTPAAALQNRRKRRAAESLLPGAQQRRRCSGATAAEPLSAASPDDCLTLAARDNAAAMGKLPMQQGSTPLAEAAPLCTPAPRPRGLFAAGAVDRSACASSGAGPFLQNLPCRRRSAHDTPQPAKSCSTPLMLRCSFSLHPLPPAQLMEALRDYIIMSLWLLLLHCSSAPEGICSTPRSSYMFTRGSYSRKGTM